jgi:hypothetical protein
VWKFVVVSAAVWVGLAFNGLPAAAKQAAQQDQGDPTAKVDQLAQRIFNGADQNHNHVLNKNEFQNAQAALQAAVAEWGRTGVIGQPKKPGHNEKAGDRPAVLATSSPDKLAKSNKVSQAEFSFYAHSVVEEADQQWRQANAAAAAQRKALAQRRGYPGRGRRFVPNPYGY